MKITERRIKIGDIYDGFDISLYNGSDEDVMCYKDKADELGRNLLNCRPSYQRNFVYKPAEREKVIQTVFKGYNSQQQFPLNILYWAKMPDGTYQLLDGQQRTLSLLLFRAGEGTAEVNGTKQIFVGLNDSYKKWFDNYELTIYICEPDDDEDQARFEDEILEWFHVINIAGEPLTAQELNNASFFGPWVSAAKKDFSNPNSRIFKDEYDAELYFKIKPESLNRQEFLETVINWKSNYDGKSLKTYMSEHRHNSDADDLFNYFIGILDWIKETFPVDAKEYKSVFYGLDWGRLFNEYSQTFKMKPEEVKKLVIQLYEDDEVDKKNGIVEYILSGKNEKYLSFRAFDDSIKRATWKLQNGICPICEEKQKQNPEEKIQIKHDLKKMEGDHIIPWSQGGKTVEENCCMLCKLHNGQKSAKEMLWLKEYMDNLRKK